MIDPVPTIVAVNIWLLMVHVAASADVFVSKAEEMTNTNAGKSLETRYIIANRAPC